MVVNNGWADHHRPVWAHPYDQDLLKPGTKVTCIGNSNYFLIQGHPCQPGGSKCNVKVQESGHLIEVRYTTYPTAQTVFLSYFDLNDMKSPFMDVTNF